MPRKLPAPPSIKTLRAEGKFSLKNLLKLVREKLGQIEEKRPGKLIYSGVDVLMSGLAVFSLKYPSLLKFDNEREKVRIKHNLRRLFGVKKAPCDTTLREVCDEVEPEKVNGVFKTIIEFLKKEGLLKRYEYIEGSFLLSIDGTGEFSSGKISCEHCCKKEHKDGEKEYYHQIVVAAIVNPENSQVLPILVEPIKKGDGESKNDCELNASKRLLIKIKEMYPDLEFIVLEDGLYGNGPNIKLLEELGYQYIITVKEKDHIELMNAAQDEICAGKGKEYEERGKDGITRGYRWVSGVRLNKSHPDIRVNYFDYWEYKGEKLLYSHQWITDIPLNRKNAEKVMRAGRARWKIENETFNTLKNLGYNFEHNYGHGKKYLSTVFGTLMIIAFLIDQVQELGCILFQSARNKFYSRSALWETMRGIFRRFYVDNWEDFFIGIVYEWGGVWQEDSS